MLVRHGFMRLRIAPPPMFPYRVLAGLYDDMVGRPFRDNRQIVFSRASIEGDIYMLTFK